MLAPQSGKLRHVQQLRHVMCVSMTPSNDSMSANVEDTFPYGNDWFSWQSLVDTTILTRYKVCVIVKTQDRVLSLKKTEMPSQYKALFRYVWSYEQALELLERAKRRCKVVQAVVVSCLCCRQHQLQKALDHGRQGRAEHLSAIWWLYSNLN